jgi:hypothetical protein
MAEFNGAQAIYELATLGRLTPETDYVVRDELDLVSDEEREAHEAAEEALEKDQEYQKAVAEEKAKAGDAKSSQDETSDSTTAAKSKPESTSKPGGNK